MKFNQVLYHSLISLSSALVYSAPVPSLFSLLASEPAFVEMAVIDLPLVSAIGK